MSALPLLCVLLSAAPAAFGQREVIRTEVVAQWEFDRDTDGFAAEHHCQLSSGQGHLIVRSDGVDPYFHRPVDLPGGQLQLQLRAKGTVAGGSIYWTTDQSPQRGEDKAQSFPMRSDGQWHEYSVTFAAAGRLKDLRLDPGNGPGELEIDWIRLVREELHPISIEEVQCDEHRVRCRLKNHQPGAIDVQVFGQKLTIPGQSEQTVEQPVDASHPLEVFSVVVHAGDLPPVRQTVFLHHPAAETAWIERPLDGGKLQVARDGTVARLYRGDRLVAALAPLVHQGDKMPKLRVTAESPDICLQGDGIKATVSAQGDEITVRLDSQQPCEGPVVRALGGLEQGLFAGLEYLGKGEHSSSMLDVETDERLRYVPDVMKVTFPLMAFVTDRGSVAMTWSDMQVQPVFATPNVMDGTADHRMALRGKTIEATIRLAHVPLEELIAWYVKKCGLPPLPQPPRTREQQWELCLKGLNGPLHTADGWGHCAEDHWPRAFLADHASTIWRLTGKVPEMPRIVPGGAHVPNDSIFFVTGHADQWLKSQQQRVRGMMQQQKPDGSFHYEGKYRRGHFEDTASGACARPAWVLLDYAYSTGDRAARETGLRTLDYMKRFRTPRGAQTWELSLHTPDQLASAYAVLAYVRGFELTGKQEYLKEARRWALSGIPFVYLWTCKPVMLYGTPPVFGATNWRAPCWIGLPVQWVGGVYAYGLTKLAPYDDSVDWNHLARGILISAEQQQYPDGKWVGLLPDSFVLRSQERHPWNINPCALVSLRMVLDGQLDSLAVAVDGNHRVVAPFPVAIRQGKAHIQGRAGVKYQVLLDGSRIADVDSQGDDVVPLD